MSPPSRSPGNGKPRPRPKPPSRTPFPEPFPAELRANLDRWATDHGFSPPQVKTAIESVADWAISNGKTKADWVRTIQGAMRAGWALPHGSETPTERLERITRELEQEESNAAR
jgi:hypothetical protein